MKKILSLSPKDWLSGIAQGYHFGRGIWASATGINPFVDSQRANTRVGLLQASPAVTDITSTVVIDTPIGWCSDFASNGDQKLYFNGTGTLYSLNISNDTGLTALRTVSNMANGIISFKATGETKYLYYFQKTQIGRYDLNATYVDNWFTGLDSTVNHPTHRFFDVVFYGNGDTIGSIRDMAGTATGALNELDVGADYTITTLSDDGAYLVIGITKNIGGGSTVYPGTKILFWDTNSSSWEKEWDLDAPDILSIKKRGATMYALTSTGLFVFNYATSPEKVLSLQSGDTAGVSSTTGSHYSMDVVGNGVLWGSSSRLHYYGNFIKDAPTAYHQLFSVPNGTTTLVCSSAKHQRIYAGTTTPKFGYYDYSSSGTPDTSVSAESVYIDLMDRYNIQRIDLILGTKLATGDIVNIGVSDVENTNIVNYGGTNAVSFTNYGAKSRAKLTGTSFEAENMIIKPTFVSGAVKIKRIDIYGDKIET